FQLAFFTLQAGPIQRFTDFQRWWDDPSPEAPSEDGRTQVLEAWDRVLNGAVKMGILAVLALAAWERLSAGFANPQPGWKLLSRFVLYLYLSPAFLYLNFSGYTDIVVGSARLLGLRLPENFDRPWLARNMVDFWNRWHISLSTWIRDYVFMRTY